jgi:hypothetical protein
MLTATLTQALAVTALPVRCVNCSTGGHDWLDYMAAFGGLVGGVAAVVALVLAFLSMKDARRSADAAEASAKESGASLRILQAEHEAAEAERAKRPDVGGTLNWDPIFEYEGTNDVLLYVGMHNERGTRDADRVLLNLLVPAEVGLVRTDKDGRNPRERELLDAYEPFREGDAVIAWHYWNEYVNLTAGNTTLWHFRLKMPEGDEGCPVIMRLDHVSIPGSRFELRAWAGEQPAGAP